MDPTNILSLESYKKIGFGNKNSYIHENVNFMPFVVLS